MTQSYKVFTIKNYNLYTPQDLYLQTNYANHNAVFIIWFLLMYYVH